jgi:Ca2+-binding EF-hand superfamily protein
MALQAGVDHITPILKKVRNQLHDSGKETLAALRTGFKQYDTDRIGALDAVDFAAALAVPGVFLNKSETSLLFRCFKYGEEVAPSSGVPLKIDLFAFFDAVSGELGGDRLARAETVWASMTGSGAKSELSIDEILTIFKAAEHPRVVTKEMFAEEAQGRLAGALEEFMEMDGSTTVSLDIWLRYVAELATTTPVSKDLLFNKVLDCFEPAKAQVVPPERIEQLEIYLTDKIRQYSPLGKDGLRATLRKFFHHQDAAGNGGLNLTEFGEFLITIGMVLPDFEKEAFFAHLAAPCGGDRLGFDFLALRVETLNAGPMENKSYTAGVPPKSLVDKIRTHLLAHHPKGLQSLFLAFRHVDREQRSWLTHADFYSALRICGLRLGSQEVERLLNFFDTSRSGKVTYAPFLHAIRGEQSPERLALLDAAWSAVSTNGTTVPVSVLNSKYDPFFHPKVSNNHQTKEEKVLDMLEFMGEEYQLGEVTKASFLEYFLDESSSIPEDAYFNRYIKHAFQL